MKNNFLNSAIMIKFRLVAWMEGISFLILLFVAMPLKYAAGLPLFVKYFGLLHGVLFILYFILLLLVWDQYKWKWNRVLLAFIAALLPFGVFVLDKQLRMELK